MTAARSKGRRQRVASLNDLRRKTTQAYLAYAIARSSAETIGHRTKMMRDAWSGVGSVYHPEFAMMILEKVLAINEATVIALRQIGPAQHIWAEFWQKQWRAQFLSWPHQHSFWDTVTLWQRTTALTDAAALRQMRPIHRTVRANAKRLGRARGGTGATT